MSRRRKQEPFYLIIKDDDKLIFNVVGPIESDFDWNQKICELQESGRGVRCYAHLGSDSKESIIRMMSTSGNYKYSDQLIVEEPEDTSAEYAGLLQNYARNANRRRVVRIMCRGQCRGKTRWAEMNVDYPGEEELKSPNSHHIRARCLRCGYIARDPYNWFRK